MKLIRNVTNIDLNRAKILFENILALKEMPTDSNLISIIDSIDDDNIDLTCVQQIAKENFIATIKLIQTVTNLNLIDAKALFENIIELKEMPTDLSLIKIINLINDNNINYVLTLKVEK